MNITDGELLRRYTRDRSEAAFEEIVRRHINLIYSAALRQVNGDLQLAEDVTQSVFTDLASKAAQLTRHPSVTAWLYTSTRFIAANLRRTEQRRSAREHEAHAMNAFSDAPAPEPDWTQIRPLLDDAMHMLDAQDREAVLLRHFEHRTFAEIGEQLGLAENAARMRVTRALDKLQETLRKRGVTSTALALAALLTANGVGAAPAHLAARIARAALAGTTAAGMSALLAQFFTAAKIKVAAGILLLAGIAALVATTHSKHAASASSPTVSPTALASTSPSAEVAPAVAPTTNATVAAKTAAVTDTNGLILHLQIVAADSGQPIPHVPVEYRGWVAQKFQGKSLVSTRAGMLDVVYPTNISELELTTREDDFADTRLLWRPPHGDSIPTNYVLKLDRPVAIGGRVIDADGNPIVGAKVGWNHQDDPTMLKLPENHEFSWIETTTDTNGRWRINRMAADMITRIYGGAREPNHVDSPMVFVGRDKSVEKQLRGETHVFQLGRAVSVKGVVVDESGLGIPGAKILVGYVSGSDRREGKSKDDGSFVVTGCPPGKHLVTAKAKGYAVTTAETELADNSEPIRLVLGAGKVLRLLVVNHAGAPVPKAQIFYEPFDRNYGVSQHAPPPQVEYNPKTGKDGRVIWSNAPDVEMAFDTEAPGYLRKDNTMIRPDGEEHTITLSSALVIHGTVLDEASGQVIPHFRVALGWPEIDFQHDKAIPHWSTIGRFWLDFANGTYRHSFEESPISGTENKGYFLKFTAEGHTPVVSRLIGPDEGDVQLDISLKSATEVAVLVYTPDGQLAANADVGLVSPSSFLHFAKGGFDRQNQQSAGSLLQTGGDGSFKLPADESLQRVIVASADGYAEALPAALAANPVMQMKPWGRLEILCSSGGQPEAGREYLLELGGGSRNTVEFDFQAGHVVSDASGHISVPMMPSGQQALIHLHPTKMDDGNTGWMHGNRMPFTIRPGETTTLNLDTNYVVTAHLQWPAGLSRSPEWHGYASLKPITPGAPPEGPSAKSLFGTPGLPATLALNDTVFAQDVPPGNYTLSVSFFTKPENNAAPAAGKGDLKILATASVNLTVPNEPPSGTVDAGALVVQSGADSDTAANSEGN